MSSSVCSQYYIKFTYYANQKEISITRNKTILETLLNPNIQDGKARQVLPK